VGDSEAATAQIVPRPAVEPHPLAVLAGDDPEAVVLDLVQPALAGWRALVDVARRGWMNPAGRVCGRNDMGREIV
jgi:hypothetical protein